MKNWLRKILLAVALLLPSAAAAQNVTVTGPVTPGHCSSFFSTTQIQDSGIGCGGGGGGVTSVGLALPASVFQVVGSPVTGGGTLTGLFINQSANLVFASPASGVPAVPTFRTLVANDLASALASPPPIGTTTPAQGAFAALSATGNLTVSGNTITNITGSTQCVQVSPAGVLTGAGTLCGAAGGAVSSVSNADGTLTISPTTGAVVASLNLAHANTWTVAQTFSAGISASAITDTGITGSTQCVQANSSGVLGGSGGACGGAVASVSNADGTLTISPTTGAVVASLALGHANTWTAAQTFNNSDIILKGSSTGFTTFTSANAGASNFTATVPANTGTIAELNLAQTWSAAQTFPSSDLLINGATSGTLTLNCTATCGANTATFPANTGTIAELNLAQTFSAQQTFSSTLVFSGLSVVAQTRCLGLDAGNNVTLSTGACGGGTPGGANTQVQFNNSGAFGGDAGFTYAGNGQATLALGTITTNLKALTITGTWNAAGVTFDAPLFMNIVDTASAVGTPTALGSMYLDLQRGGGTTFAVYKGSNNDPTLWMARGGSDSGAITIEGGAGIVTIGRANDSNRIGWIENFSSTVGIFVDKNQTSGSAAFGWSDGPASADLYLHRDGAALLAQENGANAQTFRVYNTADGTFPPTIYERAVLDWTTTANTLTIGAQKGSTGTLRNVALVGALITVPGITTDAAHVTSTICQDTTSHALYFGSGAAGVCLGTSSLRFKHDVAPLNVGLEQVMALRPISYKLNADRGDPNKVLYGFSAEQGLHALPRLVGNDENGTPSTFDYMGVVPVLVKAIQEQQREIEKLNRRLH